jgi:hypothetical protein
MQARRQTAVALWLTNTLCRLIVGEIVAAAARRGQRELVGRTAEVCRVGLWGGDETHRAFRIMSRIMLGAAPWF